MKPEKGEKVKDFQQRTVHTINKITNTISKEDHNADTQIQSQSYNILLVTHGGNIRLYLAYILQIPLNLYWRLAVKNCSISTVKFYGEDPVIELLNFTEHLK